MAAKDNFLARSADWYLKATFLKLIQGYFFFDLTELAYVFEKCLKLLPWLQDYILVWEGRGKPGSGKGKRLKVRPPVVASSFLFITVTSTVRAFCLQSDYKEQGLTFE